MAIAAFWLLAGLLFWSYIGYPAYLRLRAGRKSHLPNADPAVFPGVSILISAYNEAACIRDKIANCLEFEYPPDKLEIIVASDGSTDGTSGIVLGCAGANVRLMELPRGGKAKALNALVKQAKGDILVFTDANAMLGKEALSKLVGCFEDPTVGCATAIKKIIPAKSAAAEGESAYWKYEYLVKKYESRFGSAAGADGSFYAVRREYYVPVHETRNVADDLAISINVWRFKKRIVVAEGLFSREEAHSSSGKEYLRKVRISEGSYRVLSLNLWAWLPSRNDHWLELYSHKVLRWAGPFLMLGILFCLLTLSGHMFYRALLAGYSLLLGAGVLGLINASLVPFSGSLGHFLLSNAAQAQGLLQFIFKPRPAYWDTRTG